MNLKYQTLTLDNETYEQLSQVAKRAGLSRAAYVRQTVRKDFMGAESGVSVLSSNQPSTDEMKNEVIETVIKHGVEVALSDLNILERTATRLAQKRGWTIDTHRLANEILTAITNSKKKQGELTE